MIMPRTDRGEAEPHTAGVAHFSEGGQKTYKGLPGWDRRLRWYLTTPIATEPLQWRTSTGACRCVRCGRRIDSSSGSRLIASQVIACGSCAPETAAAVVGL